ncbi:MAG: hypothetical protein WA584_16455 [Pyrinomonadaceae bacterium]
MTTAATTTAADQQAQDQIKALEAKLANDPALQAQMLANPYQTMINFGVPEKSVASFLAPPAATAADAKSSSSDSDQGMTIKSEWWGFQLSLSSQLCNDIEGGLVTSAGLSTIIAVCQPELAPIAGIIAGTLAIMGGVIQLANQGNGVHFDLHWSELALAIPTLGASLTPAMIPIPN